MKHKFRYINLQPTDQHNLEILLNRYAHEGWYLKKKIWNILCFEADPSRNRRYIVLTDYSVFTTNNKADYLYELNNTIDYLEDFDYHKVLETYDFIILEKPYDGKYITDIDLDESVSKPKRKLVYRTLRNRAILTLVNFAIIFTFNFVQSVSSLLFTNSGLTIIMVMMLLFGYSLVSSTRMIRLGYRYYKNYENPTPKKFYATHNRALDILDFMFFAVLIVLCFGTLISMAHGDMFLFTLLLTMVIACGVVLLIVGFINTKSKSWMVILGYIMSIAFSIFLLFLMFKSIETNTGVYDEADDVVHSGSSITLIALESFDTMIQENQNCRVSQSNSKAAGSVDLFCDSNSIWVYVSHHDTLTPLVSKAATGMFNIPNHTPITTSKFQRHVYRSDNVIIVSYQEIPQYFMDELNQK